MEIPWWFGKPDHLTICYLEKNQWYQQKDRKPSTQWHKMEPLKCSKTFFLMERCQEVQMQEKSFSRQYSQSMMIASKSKEMHYGWMKHVLPINKKSCQDYICICSWINFFLNEKMPWMWNAIWRSFHVNDYIIDRSMKNLTTLYNVIS